jgi:hypothetical protein
MVPAKCMGLRFAQDDKVFGIGWGCTGLAAVDSII